MVDGVEKTSHIAFENETRPCVVLTDLSAHAFHSDYTFVRSFTDTARK